MLVLLHMSKINLFLYFPDLGNLVNYKEIMFPCYSSLSIKVIWVYYLLSVNPYKFIISHLNFPNNLKYRSSHRKCSVRKDPLINFAKFTGKTCVRHATLLRKRLWHRFFVWVFLIFWKHLLYIITLGAASENSSIKDRPYRD